MTNSKILANRLREVILNGTWIANTNFKDQLEDVNWKVATTEHQSLNTISILAQHIHYYINGVKNAFLKGKLDIKDKYSFDFPEIASQAEWKAFLNIFWKDTEELAKHIEKFDDEQLKLSFVEKKYGTNCQNINALIEHAYYHLGQIVLIKKQINQ